MASNPYKNKEFKKLQKEWYSKLKENGFKDYEYFYGTDSFNSKMQPVPGVSGYPIDTFKQEVSLHHFKKAEEFLRNYKFKRKRDLICWKYYCEGYSCREISKLLDYKIKHVTVWNTLQKLKDKMKEYFNGKSN